MGLTALLSPRGGKASGRHRDIQGNRQGDRRNVAPGAQAVPLLDQAGWHTTRTLAVPATINPLSLSAYSPELNPVENLRQCPCDHCLCGRIVQNYTDIRGRARRCVHKPAAFQ